MEAFTISGKLKYDYDWIFINGESLSECLEEFSGKNVQLNYYISDQPITDENLPMLAIAKYCGDAKFEQIYFCGSEWTGTYGEDDIISVNGHDLTEELRAHKGKYCLVKINLLDQG